MLDSTNTLGHLQGLQIKRSLWESKSKEYSNSERRKREYGEPLQHVKVLEALFVSCPHFLDQDSCQSQVPVHQPWSGSAQTTSVHFTLYITIYMDKAAAERLFLTRRILKCGLKCLTKIKSNKIDIDKHTNLHDQIFFHGSFSLIYHHSCEHYSKDYVTKYINKDSSTNFLLRFSLLCVNANTLPKFL